MDLPDLGNALCAPDSRHAAFVPVAERLAGFVFYSTTDFFPNILAHLDGHRSYSGNRCAILLKVCEVADDEDLRISFNVQSVIHDHASAAVNFAAERLTQRGS